MTRTTSSSVDGSGGLVQPGDDRLAVGEEREQSLSLVVDGALVAETEVAQDGLQLLAGHGRDPLCGRQAGGRAGHDVPQPLVEAHRGPVPPRQRESFEPVEPGIELRPGGPGADEAVEAFAADPVTEQDQRIQQLEREQIEVVERGADRDVARRHARRAARHETGVPSRRSGRAERRASRSARDRWRRYVARVNPMVASLPRP